MRVCIDTRDPAVAPRLLDPDDFKGFKVIVEGPRDALAEAISPVGHLAGPDHALIYTRLVTEMAGDRAMDDARNQAFESMLAYAESKGWMSEDGSAIQAHCEFTD